MNPSSTPTSKGRARKGAGSITRRHVDSCPALIEGARADHDCRGGWKGQTSVIVGGRKQRKAVYGKTENEVAHKLKLLVVGEAGGTLSGTSMKVEQWLDQWLAEAMSGASGRPPLKATTARCYSSRIEHWLKPSLGARRLDRLDRTHLHAMYATMRAEGLAEGTVRLVHVILHAALKTAQMNGLVPVNVADQVVAPSKTAARVRQSLTTREAEQVLLTAGDDARPFVALLCGLRQGEALGLRWSDVNLGALDEVGAPAPYLVVHEAAYRPNGAGGGMAYGTPKSQASTDRVVPLPAPVARRLALAKARQHGRARELVFVRTDGKVLNQGTDLRNWYALLARAGVPRVVQHSARQTCGKLLEDAGVPVRVVAEILGHSEVTMTFHYQTGNLAAKQTAMKALDSMGGKGVTGLHSVTA